MQYMNITKVLGEKLPVFLGCSVYTIANYVKSERIYKGYKIKIHADDELTEEDLQKWDDFIKPCRKKKKRKLRKPQELK